MLIESDVLNAVVMALGNPSLIEFPQADREDALRRGLIQYSQFRPLRKLGSFDTVVDQQVYDLGSSYSYLIGITNVFYGPGDFANMDSFYAGFYNSYINTSNFSSVSTLDQQALRVIDNRMLAVIQASQRYDFHRVDDDNIALIPTPEDVKTIFFTYSDIRTLSDLRERDYQDTVDFMYIAAASIMAEIRSKILQMNTPDIGFIMFRSGEHINKIAAEKNKALAQKFGVNSFITHG